MSQASDISLTTIALFYLLSYGLILPLYFVFDRFLGLDLKRWKVYSDDSFQNLQISRRVAIAMAIYLLGIYLSVEKINLLVGLGQTIQMPLFLHGQTLFQILPRQLIKMGN